MFCEAALNGRRGEGKVELKDKLASDMLKALEKNVPFPISGYKTSVDWAASALIEL